MKTILCLGAGLVARPYVQYLSDCNYHIIVASRTKSKADRLIEGIINTETITFNIKTDDSLLEELVSKADLVCSLLPFTFHVKAAKIAIKYKVPFCTTSYISDEMNKLDKAAKNAGIILLNECGVDPGMDHMSAQKIIDGVHKNDGKIISFTSYCGGLPAPDANNNPFGYKFSWSPRGVLLAGRNDARFYKDSQEVLIKGEDLFDNYQIFNIPDSDKYEGYPNRDSISYIDIYGIQETKTIIRGTLRNIGWCSTLKKIADFGLLDLEERSFKDMTYANLSAQLSKSKDSDLKKNVADTLGLDLNDPIIARFEWLGLLSDEIIPPTMTTNLDALCHIFQKKLKYAEGERDMLVMHHEFIIEYSNHKDKITSTFLDYGIPNGDSSMSRTVALPVAIASRMILERKITITGVHRPIIPEIYNPILAELESLGMHFKERESRL